MPPPSTAHSAPAPGPDTFRHQLELRGLVAALATRFVSLAPENVDAAVCEALEAVGAFAGADRAILAIFEDDYASWSISHEWFRPGLAPFGPRIQHVPSMPWTMAEFHAHRPIRVVVGADEPGPASQERDMVRSLGLSAAFLIPVFIGDRLVGATGIGAAATPSLNWLEWSEDLTTLLELPGRMMVDTLARRATERTRRANEALWRSFCACEVVGVFVLARDGRIVESNDTGLRILGRSRDELTADGIAWENTTPPEYRPLDVRALERLDRGGLVLPWEKQVERPDGSRVPVLSTLASLSPFGPELLSLCIDLTERERAQQELRRDNQLDRLLTSLPQRLITLPAAAIDATITEALGEIGRFFGLVRVGLFETGGGADVESLRLHWQADGEPPLAPQMARIQLATLPWWRERLRSGRVMYLPTLDSLPAEAAAEKALLQSRGIQGLLAVPLYPGRVSRGAIHFASRNPLEISDQHLALLRVFCDIVANALERKRAEEEIREAGDALERRVHQRRAQLEASNAELEAFAYSVSHDLRAPLRIIDGLSRMLLEDFAADLEEGSQGLIRRMLQATLRMSDLIDGLLQLSRVVRTEMISESVDLSALVADLVRDRTAAEPARDMVVDIEPGIVVRGHENLLRIAMTQLIDNAWKFTARRATAHIHFGAEEHAGERRIFLRDDGVGFDSTLAGRLFGAFHRLHGMAEFEGHGIGLATVERIVRMHQGRVWAEGAQDRGAVVFFVLASGGGAESA